MGLPTEDLTGKRFYRWLVLGRAENINQQSAWFCKCDCGTKKTVMGYSLRAKTRPSKSCGCYKKDKTLTHGKSRTPEFYAWNAMKTRCLNPNDKAYKNYGARGISVCDRWLSSFENFLEDMGEKPSKAHSLDRINNNSGYCPINCRWATRLEQNNNTRRQEITLMRYIDVLSYGSYRVRRPVTGAHLGVFKTLEDAIQARNEMLGVES